MKISCKTFKTLTYITENGECQQISMTYIIIQSARLLGKSSKPKLCHEPCGLVRHSFDYDFYPRVTRCTHKFLTILWKINEKNFAPHLPTYILDIYDNTIDIFLK